MHPKKLTFGQRLIYAFGFCFIVLIISEAIQLHWLYNLAWTVVGITFLIWPDIPSNLRIYWPEDKCLRFGCQLGICCIIGAWMVRNGPPR